MTRRMVPRLRVFVSSRMSELEAERRQIKEALGELNVDAWVFEIDAGARSESIEATFLEEVAAADLYLGLFWKGYGAYTREEYEYAGKLRKDRLVYEKSIVVEAGREAELRKFLEELNRVEGEVTPKRFQCLEELREFVKEDVAGWQTRVIRLRHEVDEIVQTLTEKLDSATQQRQVLEDLNQSLVEAVTALASQRGQPDAPAELDVILAALKKGRTEPARRLFQQVGSEKEALGGDSYAQAAEAQRHLGSLAFFDDVDAALAAYRKATELDPGHPEGWNQLGHLLLRTRDLPGAEGAYQTVLALGRSTGDAEWEARALRNLGAVYGTRGDLEGAAKMFEKALALHKRVGSKAGMAVACENLGIVHQRRDEPDRAVEMFAKALAINEELGRKQHMAANYGRLGYVYVARGETERAQEAWTKARET